LNTSPSEPLWLDLDGVLKTHEDQIELFGGAVGVRDLALVESALARPQQLYHYNGEVDVLTLAVRLGVGIAQNHGFVDGNKRTGFVAMLEFLGINGYVLAMPGDTTPGVLFEAAVMGDITEAQLIEDLYPYVQALDF
jgi:death on curing protein